MFLSAVLLLIYLFHMLLNKVNRENDLSLNVTWLQAAALDRNKNGKPDTIAIDFVLESNSDLIAFGGTEVCIQYGFFRSTCKNLSFFVEPKELYGTDGHGHDVIQVGENKFRRYIYFHESQIPHNISSNQKIRISVIGSNSILLRESKKIETIQELTEFEALNVGQSSDANYPDYGSVYTPVE